MKIKRVEISAFRIYDDPKNATFDFADRRGEIADFVSLYAPNGFGKTSFYDAVEWGVTKSINRFYIRSKELEKLADFQSVQNKMPLIKNSKSTKNTYVKVTTDSEIFDSHFSKNKRQNHDFNFKKPVVHDFQQVMLSQEWISAFLTESDGETRYKKFMEKPDLSEINNYYINLKLQISVLKDEKEKVRYKINQFKSEIITEAQQDLLTTINSQIDHIISEFSQGGLFKIELSTTKEKIKDLKDIIGNNRAALNFTSSSLASLENISIARSGNENICGVSMFFEYRKLLDELLKDIVLVGSNIEEFKNIEKLSNEVIELKKNISILVERRDNAKQIIDLFEEYQRNQKLLLIKISEQATIAKVLETLKSPLELKVVEEAEFQIQLNSSIAELDASNDKISKLPELKEQIFDTLDKIVKIESSIKIERENLSKPLNDIKHLDANIEDIKKVIELMSQRIYSVDSVRNNLSLVELISALQNKNEDLSIKKKTLNDLNQQITQQRELDSEIQKFVASGMEIVNKRLSSACPLCEQQYDSFAKLAEKIANNSALELAVKSLLSNQTSLSYDITLIEDEIIEGNKKLMDYYDLDLAELIGKRNVIQNNLASLNQEITIKMNLVSELRTKLTEYNIQIGGVELDVYEKSLSDRTLELIKLKTELSAKIKSIQAEIEKIKEEYNLNIGYADLKTIEINELLENENYNLVVNWFNLNYPAAEIDLSLLNTYYDGILQQIKAIVVTQSEKERVMSIKEILLQSFTEEGLNKRRKELEVSRIDMQQKIDGFINFVKEIGVDNPMFMTTEELSFFLSNKETQLKAEVERAIKLNTEYDKLESYSENIVSFLQSENARQEITKLELIYEELEKTVEPILQDEKIKTKEHLQMKIQDFFYERLINDLYKKIDPHPEFREVKFKADFESESPRLDVFVKSKDDETLLIPNLYFSTAQINILSLSIFLATALNSPKYDCIFIDDPIQSMDSINVLSTIDLFRSIVVNYNKQIILSTHDENFYNLLQKKMPPELFKSKFFRLESFGILNRD